MIAIIDYGAGNLQSVAKAMAFIGHPAEVTGDPEKLLRAERAILPGVGSFGDAMNALRKAGMEEPIVEFARSGRPLLGICLGMQLLFEGSEESPGIKGLGLLEGEISRIPAGPGLKIPHIGWNSLRIRQQSGLFEGLAGEPYVYFVHSYYLHAKDRSVVSSQTDYGVAIDASIASGNLHATQFHPEKSGRAGLQMLRNFMKVR